MIHYKRSINETIILKQICICRFRQCGLHSTDPRQVSAVVTFGHQHDQLCDCQLSFECLTENGAVCSVTTPWLNTQKFSDTETIADTFGWSSCDKSTGCLFYRDHEHGKSHEMSAWMQYPCDKFPMSSTGHYGKLWIRAAVDEQGTVRAALNASRSVCRYNAAIWLLSASIIQQQLRRRLSSTLSATVVYVQRN
jgi:hypothetical protein